MRESVGPDEWDPAASTVRLVEPLLPVQVTPELRATVDAMVERLPAGVALEVRVAAGWSPFARALGFDPSAPPDGEDMAGTPVIVAVGPIALAVASFAESEASGAAGFVAPAAFRRRRWQRQPTVFLDPTMAVWAAGWTPIALDRVDVAGADATVEVVVGRARPTPVRSTIEASALDDAD